jgi:hypothetical protein
VARRYSCRRLGETLGTLSGVGYQPAAAYQAALPDSETRETRDILKHQNWYGLSPRPHARRLRAPLQPPTADLRPCLAGAVLLPAPLVIGPAHPCILGLAANAGFLDLSAWQAEYTPRSWRTTLAMGVDEEAFGGRLQEASRRGRPLSSDEFAQNLEKQTSEPCAPSPPAARKSEPTSTTDSSHWRWEFKCTVPSSPSLGTLERV